MQPNGNIPGTMGRPVAGAPVNNVNVKPALVPTPPPAPKPVEPAFGNGGSVVEGKGGKKTGWILAVVFLLIVAAGGVGFGVWAMMDGNAQKDALNERINNLKKQNNELQEKLDSLSEKKNEEGETTGVSYEGIDVWEDGSKNIESAFLGKTNQVDIKDWGLSLKIPETLDNISYSVRRFDDDGQDGFDAFRISGTISGIDEVPDFANMNLNVDGLAGINRLKKGQSDERCVLIFSDDNYDYCFVRTLEVYSSNEDMIDLESQSFDLIQQVVLNPENYSKI